jgi:hypothetical protein
MNGAVVAGGGEGLELSLPVLERHGDGALLSTDFSLPLTRFLADEAVN